MILALISHRFGFTSHWSVAPVDKSPFGRRFSIHGFAQILSLQQRFSLNFAAIDISLHANYAFFFGTRIARITRICCLVSKDSRDSRDSCSKINTQYYFLVAHGSHGFFRCKQRFVYHQDCVSTIFQVVTPISFLKKVIFVSFCRR